VLALMLGQLERLRELAARQREAALFPRLGPGLIERGLLGAPALAGMGRLGAAFDNGKAILGLGQEPLDLDREDPVTKRASSSGAAASHLPSRKRAR
jgi:hypothetical protein